MLEVAALVLFPALMAYAAASDLLTMTISNRVSIALVVGFCGNRARVRYATQPRSSRPTSRAGPRSWP